MFSKENRNSRKDVEQIFKLGVFVSSLNLTLKFILTKEKSSPKISLITPKNISKKAVIRNLLRRRGYFILRKYLNVIPSGFSGAFIFGKKSISVFGGKKNKKHNPIINLENEIKAILNKI